MARGSKVCPFCGRNIRETDKFCPFCGKNVLNWQGGPQTPRGRQQENYGRPRQQVRPQTTQNQVRRQPQPQQQRQQPEPKPQKVVEEKIPDNLLAQLELRSEIRLIDINLKEIRDKVDQLALKLTSDDTEGVEEKVKIFSDEIKDLKSKKRELEMDITELPFEELKSKRSDVESRIAKLQNAFSLGEIAEHAYNKLRSEYEETLRDLDRKAEQQKVKIEVWVRNMRIKRDNLSENIELLKARHVAGEFSDAEYIKQKDSLRNQIKKLESNIKILNDFI